MAGSKAKAANKLLNKAKNKSPRQSQRIARKQDAEEEASKRRRRHDRQSSSQKKASGEEGIERSRSRSNSGTRGSKVTSPERVVKDHTRKFEDQQLDLLLKLVFKKIHILEGNISNAENGVTRDLKHSTWQNIADQVNRLVVYSYGYFSAYS